MHKLNSELELFNSLTSEELKETNGGMAAVAGAGAVLTGCGMVLGCILLGVALGVGVYYGVKWLLSD